MARRRNRGKQIKISSEETKEGETKWNKSFLVNIKFFEFFQKLHYNCPCLEFPLIFTQKSAQNF